MPHACARIVVLVITAIAGLVCRVDAQCVLQWDQRMATPGTNTDVGAAAVLNDTDGATLYVGGSFPAISGESISYIRRLVNGRWQPVGTGLDGSVRCMAVYQGSGGPALYVSGEFTHAGGVLVSGLAVWNGSNWSDVPGGGANDTISSLQQLISLDGTPRLYATGAFTQIGGVSATRLAQFDGTEWSAVNNEQFVYPPTLSDYNDPNTIGRDLHIIGTRILPRGGTQNGLWRLTGQLMVLMNADIDSTQVSNIIAFDDGSGPSL